MPVSPAGQDRAKRRDRALDQNRCMIGGFR
jgi:hypothetical protein